MYLMTTQLKPAVKTIFIKLESKFFYKFMLNNTYLVAFN